MSYINIISFYFSGRRKHNHVQKTSPIYGHSYVMLSDDNTILCKLFDSTRAPTVFLTIPYVAYIL